MYWRYVSYELHKNYIEPISNRNTITCVWVTGISAILLQPDLSKWRLSKLAKLDKLYINSVSTRILQGSKIDYIEYKNKIFPNY